jgi:hypothetical protein
VPLSAKERQKNHRDRVRRDVTEIFRDVTKILSIQLEIKAELESLRHDVAKLAENKGASILLLSSSSDSKESKASFRESAQARRARLDAWLPDDANRDLARKRGHGDSWVDDQAVAYRAHQHNAKTKHKDFDAGFTSWILRAETFEGKPNGHGRPRPSPVDNLYRAAFEAAEIASRERNRH